MTQPTKFTQHIRHIPPLTTDNWHLVIDGDTQRPLTLRLSQLRQYPTVQQNIALTCAGHTPQQPMITEAAWEGIALPTLLDIVQPNPSAQWLNIYSADGYATAIPIDDSHKALLVHRMDGEALSPENGYPLRLMIRGKHGYKMAKWLTHIVPAAEAVTGFWEGRGLSSTGNAKPLATLSTPPQTITIGESLSIEGVAYGGNAPLAQVDIRIDDGDWFSATINSQAAHELINWQTQWQPTEAGQFTVTVRAINQQGDEQTIANRPVILVQVTA